MSPAARWSGIAGMLLTLCVLFIVSPKLGAAAALVILLIGLGWGIQNQKFSLGA